MDSYSRAAELLASVVLAGAWDEQAIVNRAAMALQCRPRWLRPLIRRLLADFVAPARRREHGIRRYVEADFSRRESEIEALIEA